MESDLSSGQPHAEDLERILGKIRECEQQLEDRNNLLHQVSQERASAEASLRDVCAEALALETRLLGKRQDHARAQTSHACAGFRLEALLEQQSSLRAQLQRVQADEREWEDALQRCARDFRALVDGCPARPAARLQQAADLRMRELRAHHLGQEVSGLEALRILQTQLREAQLREREALQLQEGLREEAERLRCQPEAGAAFRRVRLELRYLTEEA